MLGYPTQLIYTLQPTVGYPSAPSKCCRVTVRQRCARILAARGRLIIFDSGPVIRSGQVHIESRYLVSGKNVLGGRLGLESGLWCLLENGNSKKFSQYFLSKLSFDKLSWVFCNLPSNFFLDFLSKVVFQVQVWVFMESATNFAFGLGFKRKWNIVVKK
jgi:hypothetical protein